MKWSVLEYIFSNILQITAKIDLHLGTEREEEKDIHLIGFFKENIKFSITPRMRRF